MPIVINAYRDVAAYVGLPFVDGGRALDGVDCWGLVRLVLGREAGLDLPAYGEIAAAETLRVTGAILDAIGGRDGAGADPWRRVAAPKALDVAVMRGAPLHVGVMIDPRRLLHVERATHSVIVSASHPSVRGRVIGFFRHRGLEGRDLDGDEA